MDNKLVKIFFNNNKLKYSLILVLIFLCSILQILISMSYRYIVEYVNLNNIFQISIAFFVLWICKFLITYFIKILGISVDIKSKTIFTNILIDRFYNEEYSEIEKNGTDYYSTINLRDVENISRYTSKIFIPISLGVTSFIFAIGIGLYLSPFIILLIVSLSFLSMYLKKFYKNSLITIEKSKMNKYENLNKLLMSLKLNQITIHTTKCQNYIENLIMKAWGNYKREEEKYINVNAKSRALNFGVGLITNTIWMVVALYMVYSKKLSLGSFLVFMTLSNVYNWTFFELPWLNAEKYSVENSYKKILEYNHDNENKKREEDILEKENFNSIELIDIEYKYKDTDNVIKFPYIKINSGDWIAIQGDSGVGKTTLSKILLGLYKPTTGIIKINGKISSQKNFESISFGYSPQNINIFLDESLSYNINLNDEELTDMQKYFINVEMFGNFINSKTMRKNADKLSGGELKYLGVLRAMSKNADIIVLDEFSAGLDKNSVDKVLDMLKMIKTTIVFITHDSRVVKKCNRCVILNEKYND